jgi:hypothetical protein
MKRKRKSPPDFAAKDERAEAEILNLLQGGRENGKE